MAKRYTRELATWAQQRSANRRRLHEAIVAFMAVKAHVAEAMGAGYALSTIWEHMTETGKIRCGYETFRKHVHRFILSCPPEPQSTAVLKSPSAKATPPLKKKASVEQGNGSPGITGFTFDPKPNEEDLL